jgi:hypothetical protein
VIAGVLIMVGAIIGGGAVYAGLEKAGRCNEKTKIKNTHLFS